MANKNAFFTDHEKVQGGDWIKLGPDYDDLEVHVKGFTDAFIDDRAARQRKAASQGYDNNTAALPTALVRKINIECLIKHVMCDPPVRNYFHDEEGKQPVTPEEFLAQLRDPNYRKLAAACYAAANRVGESYKADLDDAVKN